MRAIVVHKYGGPEELKFEEYWDPSPGAGEVLVRVAAASVNPIDIMRRSGVAKDFAPIKFPGIVGVDLSGTVAALGHGVKDFSLGDKVLAMADQTYAELCVVPASSVVKIPAGMDLVEAAALPLVTTTRNQLISLARTFKPARSCWSREPWGVLDGRQYSRRRNAAPMLSPEFGNASFRKPRAWARTSWSPSMTTTLWESCQSWMLSRIPSMAKPARR
jgi:hypothetical protein